VTLSSVRKHL